MVGSGKDSMLLCSDQSATSECSLVGFSDVKVRQYERVAGDHPDVTDPHRGPPLSIGWRYCECEAVSVESYEKLRRISRSSVLEPINGQMRKNILQYGFQVPESECHQTMKDVSRSKKLREKTNKQSKYGERLEMVMFAVTRKGR
jgi:hypothetical protein